MSRSFSLAALTVLELTPPQMVSCAAEAGYSHVGMRLLPATPTERPYDLVGDTPLLRELLQRLADTGVRVLDAEIFRLKPDTVVADCEPALATAARLGATELLVAGNDPDEARLTERFGAFCELAARHGLGVNLEFMSWTDAKNLPQAARIVAAAGQPNGGVLIDAYHLSRSGSRVADIASLPASHWRYLQLCDAPAAIPPTEAEVLAEARAERLFPGDGGLDLVGLLRALPATLPISIEAPTVALAQTVPAVERARRALAAARRVVALADAG